MTNKYLLLMTASLVFVTFPFKVAAMGEAIPTHRRTWPKLGMVSGLATKLSHLEPFP